LNNPVKARKKISVGGAATLLIVVALFGQLLGLLRYRLISANYTNAGDPGASDAFFVAFQIPDFFFYTIAAGALGVAFIPILADKLQRGDKKALSDVTSSLLNVMAIIMAVVGAFMFIFASQLVYALAPDMAHNDPDNFNKAVLIMRIIAFNPMLFTLSGVITSVQQTYGRFFFYATAPLVYNLSIIVSLYIFTGNIGVVGLGIGAVVGAVLALLVAIVGMKGLGFRYRPVVTWEDSDFRTVMSNLPARSLDQGIDQVNSIVETNRAQALGVGAVSYYNFALTLQNVPILLIGNSIATAAFPKLTERLSQNRRDLFRKDFLDILRVMIWLAAPVVIISYFARGYLARLISGDVSPEVALIFGFLAASIFFRIIYTMISRWFYAQKDTRTPLYVSIFAIALNIILAFALARPQSGGGYDIAGLAIAQSIVAFAEVGVLTFIMVFRDRKMLDPEFIGAMTKIVAVSGFTVITAFVMVRMLPLGIADRGIVTLGFKLVIITLVTLLVHVVVSWVFGLRELDPVIAKVKKIIFATTRPLR
jgi:putative peptidoglycan lipid II flippase